nr:hypothetical protein [uncultured Cupriavidus sp.]
MAHASRCGVDTVVTGTHGRRGLKRAFLGRRGIAGQGRPGWPSCQFGIRSARSQCRSRRQSGAHLDGIEERLYRNALRGMPRVRPRWGKARPTGAIPMRPALAERASRRNRLYLAVPRH